MPIESIPPNDRTERFVAAAGQTVFPFDFPIYAAGDIEVRRLRAGAESVLVLGSQYTVAGAGEQAGGSVTLTAGAQAGDVIALRSAQAVARTTKLTDGGDLPAAALNAEFNRLVISIQQAARQLNTALRAADTDAAPAAMPIQSARAGKYLGFDALGNPIAVDGQVGGAVVTPYMATLLAAMDAVTARGTLGAGGAAQWCGLATGTAQAQAVAPIPAISAYVDGQAYRFIAAATNTAGEPALAVSGLAPRPIRGRDGTILWPGALVGVCDVVAVGGEFRLLTAPSGLRCLASAAPQNVFAGAPTPLVLSNPGGADRIGAWTAGAPARLTMLSAGTATISGTVIWGGATASARIVQIRRNGTIVTQQVLPAIFDPITQAIAAVEVVQAGDYLEIIAFQDSGVTMTASGSLRVSISA